MGGKVAKKLGDGLMALFGYPVAQELGEQFCTDGFCQRSAHEDVGAHGRVLMSETDQFWQYAREAMLSACDAKTSEDKQDLLELPGFGRKLP